MESIALRDLRNDPSGILRRVEGGERLIVTVDRRPVAALVPLERRRAWVRAPEVWARIQSAQADAQLSRELGDLLGDRLDQA
ncbi:MAG: type II toxin-antitoxin system Phd/YefM family antitoxin [Candidatus Dormibacteria bacterium]